MSDRKDCKQTNCKYYDTSYVGNCKIDRCVYFAKGKPKEGELRPDIVQSLISDLSDEDLMEFSETISTSSIYEEEPVGVREFILSPDYLDMQADGRIWEENITTLENIFSGQYNEAYLIGGIGMGKSTISSLAALYAVYRIIILKNPHSIYRMVANSPIEIVILSINEMLAKDIIFTYALNACMNSQFFRRKEYAPNPDIKSRLQFPKNISIVPLSGSKTAGISRNVIVGLMDEAAFYPTTSGADKATIQYSNLSRRIKSRFEKQNIPESCLKGMLIAVSSPCNKEDFMENSFKNKKDTPGVYLKRCTSFETKNLGEYSGRSFNFCTTCRKIVNDDHIRKHVDVLITNKHERKDKK
jgi:hypothetical protein